MNDAHYSIPMTDNFYASRSQDIFCLIPARGGSKSIARKNLIRINGVSLVELAVNSAKIEGPENLSIVVSSDDLEILQLSVELGVKPVERSINASNDQATASQVVSEFIETLKSTSGEINRESIIIYLQPTSPMRSVRHVQEALKVYYSNKLPVVSVTEVSQIPEKMLRLNEVGQLEPLILGSNPAQNRQSFKSTLIPNGAVYIFSIADFERISDIPVLGAIPYAMSAEDSIDLDNPFDIKIAELLASPRSN